MTLNQNLIPNEDVSLTDLLNLHEKGIKLSLNCHHVGIIDSFDATTQTARVKLVYKKSYLEPDSRGVYKVVPKEYPLLLDVPVVFLGGGQTALTFPVTKGDECLVLFNDRAIDSWFSAGSVGAEVPSTRLHSISDGFALVGIRSVPKVVKGFDTDGVAIRHGTTKILAKNNSVIITLSSGLTFKVTSSGKVSITNVSGELISTLIDLFNDASQGVVAGAMPEPIFSAHMAILESFKE